MGTVTISVDDDVERRFRAAVEDRFGTGKGKLGKAVTKALESWMSDVEEQKLRARALKRLEKGLYKLPKNYTFKRGEAYEHLD